MSKHTPGPWFSTDDQNPGIEAFAVIIYAGTSKNELYGIQGKDREESIANARLIAAAPELLEALQAAVDCGMVPNSSASEGGAAKYSRQVVVADMIRAAIAKATEGQQ